MKTLTHTFAFLGALSPGLLATALAGPGSPSASGPPVAAARARAVPVSTVMLGEQVSPNAGTFSTPLDEPSDFQFYQRDLNTIGVGSTPKGTARAEARFRLAGLNSGKLVFRAWINPTTSILESTPIQETRSAPGVFTAGIDLPAGLDQYTVNVIYVSDFPTTTLPPARLVLNRAERVVAGDSFLVMGQSNAVAEPRDGVGTGLTCRDIHNRGCDPELAPQGAATKLVRSFGYRNVVAAGLHRESARTVAHARNDRNWYPAQAIAKDKDGFVGAWPLGLAYRIVESQEVAVAVINGARGSTVLSDQGEFFDSAGNLLIDSGYHCHERDDQDPDNFETMYGQLLLRTQNAGLADKVRAMLWLQGESERGTTGLNQREYGRGLYAREFLGLYLGWTMDYPSLERVFVLQVRSKQEPLDIGETPSPNVCTALNSMIHVIEDQRDLSGLLASPVAMASPCGVAGSCPPIVSIPTAGIDMNPGCACDLHYTCQGYAQIAGRAFSAVAYELGYSLTPFVALSPAAALLTPPSSPTGTGTVDVMYDPSGPSLQFTMPNPALMNQVSPAESFSLGEGYLVTSATMNGPHTVTLSYTVDPAAPDLSPDRVSYWISRESGQWLAGNSGESAFGFTLGL